MAPSDTKKDFNSLSDKIIDYVMDHGKWCIGTLDDLIEMLNRLDEDSERFGGALMQAQEGATREQVDHSYELVARYAALRLQGSLSSPKDSQQ